MESLLSSHFIAQLALLVIPDGCQAAVTPLLVPI